MNINPMTNQQIHEQIDKVATLENAKEWESEQEKFTFCIDLLGISAHSRKADSAVDKLEARFRTLLMNDYLNWG